MTISLHQLRNKKISKIIAARSSADIVSKSSLPASLLALFIVMETLLHWLWFLFVWGQQDLYGAYVDMNLFYVMWLGVTMMGLFFWWLFGHLLYLKNDDKYLHTWQIVLIGLYSIYIAIVILVTGYSSLVSGISLMGSAMLGMLLMRRRYIWKAFLFHITLILLVTFLSYLGIDFSNLQQQTISSLPNSYNYLSYREMTIIDNATAAPILLNGTVLLSNLQLSSMSFWRITHIYLALPKAVFIVYVFRALLTILDSSKAKIIKYANEDELTQLYSRRYGLTQMQQALMAMTDKQQFSVIILDLDRFKEVNDNYGHAVGDQALREVAQTLLDSLTDTTVVSRYGGEEFLIVLPDMGHDGAIALAEQLRQNIAQHVITTEANFSFQVSASLGLYTLNYHELRRLEEDFASTDHADIPKLTKSQRFQIKKSKSMTAENLAMQPMQFPIDICQYLIGLADKALYKAKAQGRNQVVSANDLLADGSIAKSHNHS